MEFIDRNGTWKEQKIKLKKRFAVLMDSDLILEEGKKQEMVTKLQIKLNLSKDELDKILSEI
jgi:uncharacterized protein YjbJ (UPF0337 family)